MDYIALKLSTAFLATCTLLLSADLNLPTKAQMLPSGSTEDLLRTEVRSRQDLDWGTQSLDTWLVGWQLLPMNQAVGGTDLYPYQISRHSGLWLDETDPQPIEQHFTDLTLEQVNEIPWMRERKEDFRNTSGRVPLFDF